MMIARTARDNSGVHASCSNNDLRYANAMVTITLVRIYKKKINSNFLSSVPEPKTE